MTIIKQLLDEEGKITSIATDATGRTLLSLSHLNKGSAFSLEERTLFDLLGKIPWQVENLGQQVERVYKQLGEKETNLQKNLFLRNLHDTNETLFYKLISQHLKELLPIIYTPTIAEAVRFYSREFRRPRGIYLCYPDRDRMEEIFDGIINDAISPSVAVMVVSDGERVLGLGDQGVGGLEICVGKSMVYVACGGLHPQLVMPCIIDVGTNNEKLLNDPSYLGWRHPRIQGQDYELMIDRIVSLIVRKYPSIYLHWEDFGRENARRNLERYRDILPSFNDDMQGTGAVTLAALLAAIRLSKIKLTEQRIIIYGAGTAGTGIADQLLAALIRQGLSSKEAADCFWLIDQPGLLTTDMPDLLNFQVPYARSGEEVKTWNPSGKPVDLEMVIKQIKPTMLIGCSSQPNAFTQPIIEAMAAHVERPIIFPLSNPTTQAEAHPQQLLQWTKGKALIATGSPFEDVNFEAKQFPISQCNNGLIYPGIGLGVILSKARRVSDRMLWEACRALGEFTAEHALYPALLPGFESIHLLSKKIALAVAKQALSEGLSPLDPAIDLEKLIENKFWLPQYYPYQKISHAPE